MACGHTSILQFEIFNLHFALAAAEGRAMSVAGGFAFTLLAKPAAGG